MKVVKFWLRMLGKQKWRVLMGFDLQMGEFFQTLFLVVASNKGILSPYLFILGNEVLMRLINREVDWKNISPVKVACIALAISKLCYADDVILFCKAKIFKLASLKMCLEKYCSWFGQLIIVEKSSVFP